MDKLIVSVGRIPNHRRPERRHRRRKLNERSQVEVDGHCKTNLPNVWAVGDVVRGPMLAHKASEGVMVAELIAGQLGTAISTPSPASSIPTGNCLGGQDRAAVEGRRHRLKPGKVPFMANGRALGHGDASGFVKVLACAQTDRILGVHIIGVNAPPN